MNEQIVDDIFTEMEAKDMMHSEIYNSAWEAERRENINSEYSVEHRGDGYEN